MLPRRMVLLFLAACLSWAQDRATEPIRVSTAEVLVDVVVRDAKGRAARDLLPGELQVLEDGD
ncbi:MAG: hypothetical protein NTZ56_13775 [Acidobacteria bacterium]|nr:hypothetical protein [Acidobacteriota bacterium]